MSDGDGEGESDFKFDIVPPSMTDPSAERIVAGATLLRVALERPEGAIMERVLSILDAIHRSIPTAEGAKVRPLKVAT